MNRRIFLKNGSLMTLGSMLPRWSMAQMSLPHYVILLDLDGGWDTTLSMDPWTENVRPDSSEIFIEYRQDELLPFQNRFVGPALKPLQDYFSKMNILNGVFLNSTDLGHPLLRYNQTGHGQGELASFAAEWNFQSQMENLGTIFNNATYLANRNVMQVDVGGLSSGSFGSSFPLELSVKSLSPIEQVKSQLLKMRSRIETFNQEVTRQNSVQQIRAGQVLATAFKLGLSQTASLSVDSLPSTNSQNSSIDLDTHSQHETQHKNSLLEGFSRIKVLFDDLKSQEAPGTGGQSVLDRTTVLIVSDFTRTPALNTSGGKDHNPQTNSMIVMGPGLTQGKMIGGSRLISRKNSLTSVPLLVANPLDITTQLPVRRREDVFMLRPEHVFKTIYQGLGVDISKTNPSFTKIDILKDLLK